MTGSSEGTNDSKAAPKNFGMATATFVVIASMVGTGVLTTSGYTVKTVGSNQLMLILWVVGGLTAMCGALSLAELSAAMPRSGGDYVYLSETYGPLAGFLSGWASLLFGFGGPIASSAFGAAKYILAPFGLSASVAPNAQRGLATLAIVALAIVHSRGAGPSAKAQGSMTVVKFGVLLVLGIAGIAAGWGHWGNLADRPVFDGHALNGSISSLIYISYAYTGWNGASYLAGEIEDPRRRLPRAIFLGTGLVIALYVILNLFYALALSAGEVGRIEDVTPIAQLAAVRLFGARTAGPLSIAIGLTLFASLSAFILTGPRVLFAMARAGQFPAAAGRLSTKTGAPVVAVFLQISWAIFILWMGSFEDIMKYSSLGLALFSILTIGAVFVLRVRRPEMPRPFRAPGYPITPALYLIVTGSLIGVTIFNDPKVSLVSLASIAAGVPFYYLGKFVASRRRRKLEAG